MSASVLLNLLNELGKGNCFLATSLEHFMAFSQLV